jgi:hypothetical protein
LQGFFAGNLIPRFLRRDLRLRYLQEKESDEWNGARFECGASAERMDSL